MAQVMFYLWILSCAHMTRAHNTTNLIKETSDNYVIVDNLSGGKKGEKKGKYYGQKFCNVTLFPPLHSVSLCLFTGVDDRLEHILKTL